MSLSVLIKRFCSPFVAWFGAHFPERLVRIRYFVRFKRFLNLGTPKTLNEKILYLSLRTDTNIWTMLADKYHVRSWIKDKGLENILIPIYQYVKQGETIDERLLPEADGFVIKTTHGCGDVRIFRKKSEFNSTKVFDYFQPYIYSNYGALEGGKHYMRMKPGLIIEKLLINDEESLKYSSSIIDYKFWCFNGIPYYCMVCMNRSAQFLELLIYDKDWNAHPEYMVFSHEHRLGRTIPKPKNYDRMLEICSILSKQFPCVRVDLYNLNGDIFFGEMTFTSLGGMMNYYTEDFQLMAGKLICLNK